MLVSQLTPNSPVSQLPTPNSQLQTPTCRPQAPRIVQQPQGAELQEGQPLKLSLSAEGSQPLFYQWQCSGRSLPEESTAELCVQVSLQ
jgi:hypothetical protein